MQVATRSTVGRWIAIELLIMAAIGLVLGFLGPFGTYAMPTGLRLAYWVGFILVGYVIFRPISIVAGWLTEETGLSVWLAELLTTAVAALPLTFLIGMAMNGLSYTPDLWGSRFGILYVQVAAIGFGIYLFMRLVFGADRPGSIRAGDTGDGAGESEPVHGAPAKNAPPAASEPGDQPPAILQQLPVGFPATILALEVEDHYVRVHAANRSAMILSRLSDAIAATDTIEGTQVHRSWWVARGAVMTSSRDGRKVALHLEGGLEVPVSRSHVGKLKQLGWI